MTDDEKQRLTWFNKRLSKLKEGVLCYLFSEYAKLYSLLDESVRQKVENCLLRGISNGKLDYMTGKITGRFARAATWVEGNINLFFQKEKLIEAARLHALKSPLAQNYSNWYFHKYVSLDHKENLEYYKNIFHKKKKLQANDYSFLKLFIPDKTSELYVMFQDKIEQFEIESIKPENRIPEISNLPF